MIKIVAISGQSVFDIALLYCGSSEYAFDIAIINGIEITDVFDSATEILVPSNKNNIAKSFEFQKVNFATGYFDEIVWVLESGIWNDSGVWIDFLECF